MAGTAPRRLWRAVPLTLALAMLGVVVLAGILPDTGVVNAASNCSYGKCPASQPFPLWAVSASVAVVIIALILALLLLRRSRRRPPTGGPAGPTEGAENPPPGDSNWSEGQEGHGQTWDEGSSDTGDMAGDGSGTSSGGGSSR